MLPLQLPPYPAPPTTHSTSLQAPTPFSPCAPYPTAPPPKGTHPAMYSTTSSLSEGVAAHAATKSSSLLSCRHSSGLFLCQGVAVAVSVPAALGADAAHRCPASRGAGGALRRCTARRAGRCWRRGCAAARCGVANMAKGRAAACMGGPCEGCGCSAPYSALAARPRAMQACSQDRSHIQHA